MVRMQVQLRVAQHHRIKRRAKRLGLSVSEVVRRCIDAELRSREPDAHQDRVRRALAVVGKYADRDSKSHVARDHDEILAEAYKR